VVLALSHMHATVYSISRCRCPNDRRPVTPPCLVLAAGAGNISKMTRLISNYRQTYREREREREREKPTATANGAASLAVIFYVIVQQN